MAKKKKNVTCVSGTKKSQVKSKYKLTKYFHHKGQKGPKNKPKQKPTMYDGEGDGTPLQYSCLENPMDRGTWQAAVHGVAKSWT